MTSQSSTRWKRARCFLGASAIGAACAFGASMAFLDNYGQSERAQAASAIVVLGSRVEANGQASASLRRRATKAAALFHRGMAPFVVCSGAVGEFAPSEARAAARILREKGVPSRAILLEERSRSTWENIVNTSAICRAKGWMQIVVVSEPYHLWRAQRHFADCGIEAFPSPAANPKWRTRLKMAARESLSVACDFLLGH